MRIPPDLKAGSNELVLRRGDRAYDQSPADIINTTLGQIFSSEDDKREDDALENNQADHDYVSRERAYNRLVDNEVAV